MDDAYGDEVRVTVIAAGFDANKSTAQPAVTQESTAEASAESQQSSAASTAQTSFDFAPQDSENAAQSLEDLPAADVDDANDLNLPDFLR